jgi:hypothetical protein
VVDAETGDGIDGVAVSTNGGGACATDAGHYTLIHPAGVYSIEVSDTMHQSMAKSITLNAGDAVEVNMVLTDSAEKGGCPVASALGDGQKSNLNLLRLFRDRVLKKTDAGAQYVRLYYQHGPEVVRLLERDPALKKELRACLLKALPLVLSMIAGTPMPVSTQQREEIGACLKKIALRGSAALKTDAGTVLSKIQDRSIFEELGIGSAKRAAR